MVCTPRLAQLQRIILAIPALLTWRTPTLTEWILLLAIGLLGYLSQLGNIYAYKYGEASLLAPIEYTRILWATLLGLMVFGDIPTTATIVGALVVVTASAYTIHRERKVSRRT